MYIDIITNCYSTKSPSLLGKGWGVSGRQAIIAINTHESMMPVVSRSPNDPRRARHLSNQVAPSGCMTDSGPSCQPLQRPNSLDWFSLPRVQNDTLQQRRLGCQFTGVGRCSSRTAWPAPILRTTAFRQRPFCTWPPCPLRASRRASRRAMACSRCCQWPRQTTDENLGFLLSRAAC